MIEMVRTQQDFILVLHLEMDFEEYIKVQSNSHVFS